MPPASASPDWVRSRGTSAESSPEPHSRRWSRMRSWTVGLDPTPPRRRLRTLRPHKDSRPRLGPLWFPCDVVLTPAYPSPHHEPTSGLAWERASPFQRTGVPAFRDGSGEAERAPAAGRCPADRCGDHPARSSPLASRPHQRGSPRGSRGDRHLGRPIVACRRICVRQPRFDVCLLAWLRCRSPSA